MPRKVSYVGIGIFRAGNRIFGRRADKRSKIRVGTEDLCWCEKSTDFGTQRYLAGAYEKSGI